MTAATAGAPWVYTPVLQFFDAVLEDKQRERKTEAAEAVAVASAGAKGRSSGSSDGSAGKGGDDALVGHLA